MTFEQLDSQYVWLDLSARGAAGATWAANRIALKCETLSINTSKQVLSHSLPGSGLIYGESKTAALDMGMTDKTISLSGIITEQTITKNWDLEGTTKTDTSRTLTSHEVAQLIHSYVDSSFFQKNQNPNKLIILIPSRVGDDWDYWQTSDGAATNITADTNADACPLIPFSYKTRDADNQGTLNVGGLGNFPPIVADATSEVKFALKGFIRNFSTTFTGGQPFIEFSMDFQIADVSF